MKTNLLAWVSLAVVVSNLFLLSTSRLRSMIRCVAVQGVLLSLLPLLLPNPAEMLHVVIIVVMSAVIKGVIIPHYLSRALRNVKGIQEGTPAVGYSISVVYGIVTAALSFYLLRSLPPGSVVSPFHASTAMATAFVGLFIIIVRRKILSQVVGYLVFENAGFILGLSMAAFQPLFIEMGILLDMLVGVFIMVLVINRVHLIHSTLGTHPLERLTR